MSSKLLAAAILKDELSESDGINAALFAAAFGELDDLRKQLAQIPEQVDQSAAKFKSITTSNVDDFVSVANQALKLFNARTTDIKLQLDRLEAASPVLLSAGRNVPTSLSGTNDGLYSGADAWVMKHLPVVAALVFFIGAMAGYAMAHLMI